MESSATDALTRSTMNDHPLSGTWFNKLGSVMEVVANPDGSLEGWYGSGVGDADGQYVLVGRFDTNPPLDRGRSLGWAVTYHNSKRNAHSTATWSGQHFADPPRILTLWLLTRSTSTEDVWNSTTVGRDEFDRRRPTSEEIRKARACNEGSAFPPLDEDEK